MNCRTSFTVWEWLNFDTSLVPSASRICMEVVGRVGSRGTEGGGVTVEEASAEEVGVAVLTSGA